MFCFVKFWILLHSLWILLQSMRRTMPGEKIWSDGDIDTLIEFHRETRFVEYSIQGQGPAEQDDAQAGSSSVI